MKHQLKIWPQHYERVRNGSKTYEVRKNDRNFQAGDLVELIYFDNEWQPGPIFNADELQKMWDRDHPRLVFMVGSVLHLSDFFKNDNEYVVFSLLPMKESLHE